MVGSRESDPYAASWKVEWKVIKRELQIAFKSHSSKALLYKQAQQAKVDLSEKSSQNIKETTS